MVEIKIPVYIYFGTRKILQNLVVRVLAPGLSTIVVTPVASA
jgi:hypothetical protein